MSNMDEFNDSGELYTIRNQFYTGQYRKVITYDLNQFSEQVQPVVIGFQARSIIALAEDASDLIEQGRHLFPEKVALFDVLQAWNDLSPFGTDNSDYFDSIEFADFETQACLMTIYLVKVRKDFCQAIKILSEYISSSKIMAHELEPYLLLVHLHLSTGNLSEAKAAFSSFEKLPFSSRDDIVYHVTESWMKAVIGGSDNVSNALCFYEELLTNDFGDDAQGKYHVLNVLFALTMQLKHFPEAQDYLEQINALGFQDNTTGDFNANKTVYEYLTRQEDMADSLLQELSKVNPEHPLLVDLLEKEARFDAILEKYSAVNRA